MRSSLVKLSLTILTVLEILLFGLSTAQAATTEALFRQQPTTISKGQVVEDVVVVGHDVSVVGEVSEILLIVNGDAHLESGSRTGMVIDIGGKIQQDRGATVEEVYHVSLDTPFWNGAMFGGALVLLLWLTTLAACVGLIILAVLIGLAFRHQSSVHTKDLERSVRRVGVTGLFVSLAVVALSALLALTIIGLPLAAFLICLYGCLGIVGFSIVSYWVGKQIHQSSDSERPVWLSSLIGASIIVAFGSIPIVGQLLFCIAWIVSIGAATLWFAAIWRKRRGKKSEKQRQAASSD